MTTPLTPRIDDIEDNVGENLSALRQYTLTVTASNWTTIRAIGIPYTTLDGSWHLRFNIAGTFAGAGNNNITGVTIADVVFKNVANYKQAVAVTFNGVQSVVMAGLNSYADLNTGTIGAIWNTSVSPNGNWGFSGDVELESKPSFVP